MIDRHLLHKMNKLVFSPIVLLLFLTVTKCSVEVLRPRGVALSKKMFYMPDKDFNCIDGSDTIPFSFVNDDYCDCQDGSDEPGTPACSNAFFHCINAGHVSLNIPTSRVNDNVCDCCDGSDEFNSTADCMNTCMELGRQAREEQQKQRELFEKGFSLFQQYSSQGKSMKENNKLQLESLKSVEAEEERIKAEKEAIKNSIEEKEKEALAVYKAAKEEQEKQQEEEEIQRQEAQEKEVAQAAFKKLDLDQDGQLTYQEIQKFSKFDSNNDGFVSEEEAKFFLHMKESMDLEEFSSTGWMIMKPIYMSDKVTEPPVTDELEREEDTHQPEQEENEEPYNNEEEEEGTTPDEEEEDDMLMDDDSNKPPVFPPKETTEGEKPQELPEYDENTQKLVDAANEARKIYKEAADKVDKTKEDIRRLQSDIDADFGDHEEFAVLKGQCFDYEDRYYTYRFCPFDRATQIDKSGGAEVSLGKWGSWAGPAENRYSKMKYDNGQTCWNGPSRSVMVLLQCGLENKLLSSSEPNRCEYLFEFSSPSLCSLTQTSPPIAHHHHEEL